MAALDRQRAQALMREAGVDALVLFQPENFVYATGASPGVAAMWRRGGASVAIVPSDPGAQTTAIIGDLNLDSATMTAPDVDFRPHRIWVDTVDIIGLPPEGRSAAAILNDAYRRQNSGSDAFRRRPTTYDFPEVLRLLGDLLTETAWHAESSPSTSNSCRRPTNVRAESEEYPLITQPTSAFTIVPLATLPREDHPRLARALGTGGHYIFLAELLQHGGARQARDTRQCIEAEDERWQRDVGESIAEGAGIAGKPCVDEDQPGPALDRELIGDVLPARPAEPVQPGIKEEQRQQS